MYAVVNTGGKQVKVEEGGIAVVEHIDAPVGDKVTLPVLLVSDEGKVTCDPADVAKATVTAEVLEHFKGDKVMIFKFKKRKGYKRTKGHRQEQTRLRVVEISLGAEKKPATRKAAPKKKAAEEPVVEPVAETPETTETASEAAE